MNDFAVAYRKATEEFLNLVATINPNDLDKSDSEGWTPRQVIHHMSDSETQSYTRLRRLIAEPGTAIQGYDEGKWAENEILGYKSEEINHAIAVIKAVRNSSYELILRIPLEQLTNSGYHTESGSYSVVDWLTIYTKHPLDHANQIRAQISQ